MVKNKCLMRKFKYTLDRKSLDTIYIAFIRPILEYANVVSDNCTPQEKHDLETRGPRATTRSPE